jgi:hypothetical protein
MRPNSSRASLLLLASLILSAPILGCGEVSTPVFDEDAAGGDTGGDGSIVDSAVDQGNDLGVDQGVDQGVDARPDATASPCPPTAPTHGSACTRNGLQCQYGADPRVDCKTLATCQGSKWNVSTPSAGTCPGTPTCPATEPTGSCSFPGTVCGYGDVSCDCSCGPLCGPSGNGYWACTKVTAGCPTTPANAGNTCTSNGLTCRYQCGPEGARSCTAGLWTTADGGPCPVSTRRVKHDITYLGDGEVDRIAAETTSMKLATWRYDGPLDDGRTHMGIVIEDQRQGSYSVDPRSSSVDLYGYSSMMLATVQSQQRRLDQQQKQLDALRAEMEALRAEIRGAKR